MQQDKQNAVDALIQNNTNETSKSSPSKIAINAESPQCGKGTIERREVEKGEV